MAEERLLLLKNVRIAPGREDHFQSTAHALFKGLGMVHQPAEVRSGRLTDMAVWIDAPVNAPLQGGRGLRGPQPFQGHGGRAQGRQLVTPTL